MNTMNLYVYENRSMSNDLSKPLMLENLNVDNIQIHIPKEIDGTDMGTWAWWLIYQNAKREKYSIPMTLEGVTNDEGEEEYISTVGLNHGFTGKHGTVMYAIEAVQADGSGAVTHEWHTRTYKLEIVHTLQGNQTEYSETESDIISALISRVNELITSGAEIAEIAETIVNAAETAQEVINSIPSDYSSLSDQVNTNTAAIALKADQATTDSDNGLFNLDSYLFSESTEDITFVRGVRGNSAGDSCEVVGNLYFSCTNLIPVSYGDILTVVNLMPTKFRFNVRGYTENEENSGVLISGGAKVLNVDLTESGSYSTDYSNTINAVYKNTVEIIKPLATAKYISVHARTFGAVNSTDKDREELNRCVRVIRKSPTLNSVFLPSVPPAKLPSEIPLANIPKITSAKRTKVGQYAELIGYGYVSINTTNKTMAIGAGFTLKSGKTRVNNPTIDFSELTTGHQTIYYDMTDSTIKITGYANYPNLEDIENTLYLGSVWAANTTYPVGYFSINTNMDIVVDGVKQLPRLSYFCGKTIACFGDSICLGRTTSSGTTTHLLHDILSKEYGIKAMNYAVGGACWCHRADRPHDLSALVPSSTIDTDFILLFAGTNDYGTNKVLGTIDDTPSGEVGNTFYAAMHYVLQYIFTQKPNAEVAIVTPTFRSYVSSGGSGDTYNTVRNSAGCTLGDYSDAMIEVAKLYNVPILDMRKMGPINKFNYASMLEEQSEGDHLYLHPKDATYDILYHKICNWLMTVL